MPGEGDNSKVNLRPVELSQIIKKLKFFIIFINGGILSLTDSHHHHHGQKPTMVGICHGGNVPVSHDDDDDDVCTRPLVKWIQSDLRLDQTSTHQLATRSSPPHDDDDGVGDDDDDPYEDDDGDGDDDDDGPVKG